MAKGKKEKMSREDQQGKVLDGWISNGVMKVVKEGIKTHNYTPLNKDNKGVIRKGNGAAVTGASSRWAPKKSSTKQADWIFVRDLRIAGKKSVIKEWLEFDIFAYSKKTVRKYLENSYTISNTKKGGDLHREFDKEVKARKAYIRKQKEQKDEIDPFDVIDEINSLASVEVIGTPSKSGKTTRKSGESSISAEESFKNRVNTANEKGEYIDVSGMKDDFVHTPKAKKLGKNKIKVKGTNIVSTATQLGNFKTAVEAADPKHASALVSKFKAAVRSNMESPAAGSTRGEVGESTESESSSSESGSEESSSSSAAEASSSASASSEKSRHKSKSKPKSKRKEASSSESGSDESSSSGSESGSDESSSSSGSASGSGSGSGSASGSESSSSDSDSSSDESSDDSSASSSSEAPQRKRSKKSVKSRAAKRRPQHRKKGK